MSAADPKIDAVDPDAVDPDAVFKEELAYLREEKNDLWALCLSGGGIRSATFSLGVLQGLAAKGLLGRFHYLSTVSGGGYIGSWLSSWIARKGLQPVLEQLAGKTSARKPEPVEVTRLRAYSNYLSPVWGISTDFFTLVSTFLRNLLLNWLVLIPLLAAAVLFPRVYLGILGWGDGLHEYAIFAVAVVAVVLLAGAIAYIVTDLTDDPGPTRTTPSKDAGISPGPPDPSASPGRPSYGTRAQEKPTDFFPLYCFVPIMGAALLLSWIGFQREVREWPFWGFMACGALVHLLGCMWGLWRRGRLGLGKSDRGENFSDVFFIVISGAGGGAVVYVLSLLSARLQPPQYATLAVPALLLCFWFATTLYVGLARGITSEMDREWWSRSGAWWLRAALCWLIGFALVIYGPDWFRLIPGMEDLGSKSLVAGGGLLGLITGLIGYWSHGGTQLKERAESLAGTIGVRLLDVAAIAFIVLLLIGLSYATSCTVALVHECVVSRACFSQDAATTTGKDADSPRELIAAARDTEVKNAHATPHAEVALPLFAALIVLGIGMSAFIGANTFSLHSMYGNRLVRAYLGATNPNRRPHWFTGFDPGDNLCMTELARKPWKSRDDGAGAADPRTGEATAQASKEDEKPKLLHVVNVALNLVRPSGGRLEWQQRKAASFTISPLHAGNKDLGYARSGAYAGEEGITLARAMTISGAAASPNMGYHSAAPVAFVMTLFNVRLGWWLPNPGPAGRTVWQRSEPKSNLQPLLTEALARTTGDSAYAYLSDGGHFENLGLYEMVKRRCRSIVVVDATCDWKFGFGDLEGAIRKIRIDLGITIEFRDGLPTPEHARSTQCHYALGTIRYSDADGDAAPDGRICYIKPVLSGDEDLDVARYAEQQSGKTAPFPHQSTGDQFFNEAQFESYRMLGRHSVDRGFSTVGEWPQRPSACEVPPGAAGPGTSGPLPLPAAAAAGAGLASRAGNALSSMNPGALLASAITVGGVLGVTGTVALKDDTVKIEPGAVIALDERDRKLLQGLSIPGGVLGLDEKDRRLLRELSIKGGAIALDEKDRKLLQELSIKGGVLAIDENDRKLLQELSARGIPVAGDLKGIDLSVRAVAEAVVKLSEAVKGIPIGPTQGDDGGKLDAAIAALSVQVRNLAAAVSGWKPQPGGGTERIEVYSKERTAGSAQVDLSDLNRTLVSIQESLRIQGAGSDEARNAARMLAEIIAELRKLNAIVVHMVPNRNVRGVGEGASR